MAENSRHSTRFSMRSKLLGQLLLESGSVQAEQIAHALKIQEKQGGMLGNILQEMGVCSRQVVAHALLKQVRVTDVKCEELRVPRDVADLVSRDICEAEKLCPFERMDNLLCVVMGNPLNRRAIAQIEELNHVKIKSFKAVWPKISELIQRTYGKEPAEEEDTDLDARITELEAPGTPSPLELKTSIEATGIVEVPPPEFGSIAAHAPAPGPRNRHKPERSATPEIEGIDLLDDAHAEIIQSNARGMTRTLRRTFDSEDEPIRAKVQKRAKINIDLDKLDISTGEVVAEKTEEGYDEISQTSVLQKLHARYAGEIIQLKVVADSYFYADGTHISGERSYEVHEAISELPVAEVVSESIGDFDAKQTATKEVQLKASEKSDSKKAPFQAPVPAPKERSIELQLSPATPMTAVLISESEFQTLVSNLGEDPVGEWDWQFIAAGPISVQIYDEN